MAGGQWCAYGLGKIAPELPLDQRSDDAGSLLYDSDALVAPLHLVGRPSVRLRVSADRPAAFVAVRLNDVHPDGTSERLSYGLFNLCHHSGHEHPSAFVPDQVYEVVVPMKGIAQTLPAGHRLRLAVSTSYWPMIWPSPEMAAVTVHEGGCEVRLPVIHSPAPIGQPFEPPEDAAAGGITVLRDGAERRWTTYDLGERRTTVVASRDDGEYVLDDIGTEQSFTRVRSSSVVDGDPLSARADVQCRATYRRDDWDGRVETDIALTCTATSFVMRARLAANDGDRLFAERHFEHDIARDHV